MISYKEANDIVAKEFSELRYSLDCVELPDAVNRVLAEDVYSDLNLPPFDNSAMDGYAVKFNKSVTSWEIIGEIAAGNFSSFSPDENSAVAIMTGGMIPENCDTVIPYEDVDIAGSNIRIKQNAKYKKGQHIRKAGEDLQKGSLALSKNNILKPQHIAVAASCGRVNLKVYSRLRIGVLATGDELVDIHETPAGDKIRCSNLYALLAAVKEMNMHAVNFGIVKDNKQLIRERVKWALESDLDIFITTGGVSKGKYDYLKEIYDELGLDIKFWHVYVKPGKPVLFGTYKKGDRIIFVFGLPGNPVSCLVNFLIFIKENLNEYYGIKSGGRIKAELLDDLKKADKKRHFLRGFLSTDENGKQTVNKVGSQSSGNLAEMGNSNCLIIVDEDRINPVKGETVECIKI